MPRTRNISRSQWDAANVSHTTTRNRNENQNVDEDEKENTGRAVTRPTRSHTRSHGRTAASETLSTAALVPTTGGKVLGERTTRAKTASKGKGKPSTAPLKRKKLPLQDITDQFLPAPEAANRGEETQQANADDIYGSPDDVNHVVVATAPPAEVPNEFHPPPAKFTSPLPPSSPPSDSTNSPFLEPQQSAPKFIDTFTLASNTSIPLDPYDPWQEFDNAHSVSDDAVANVSSHSDPFGFVSLERKLKVDREMVHAADAYDEEVLVADTSSPRPVRRLKRSVEEDVHRLDVAEIAAVHPHYATPPTPHKDKQKRRRMSHEGHDIFSPCTSSIESSPSPSKMSAHKRLRPAIQDDPLGDFNEELDRSYEVEVALKKVKASKLEEQDVKAEEASTSVGVASRSLRPREKRRSPEKSKDQAAGTKRSAVKKKGLKKPVSKSAPTMKANADTSDNEDGLDEKRHRERQERLEYFKRLEDYHVEKEDVYFI